MVCIHRDALTINCRQTKSTFFQLKQLKVIATYHKNLFEKNHIFTNLLQGGSCSHDNFPLTLQKNLKLIELKIISEFFPANEAQQKLEQLPTPQDAN